MKILMLRRLARYVTTYHFLTSLVVFLVLELNGVSARSDLKTKLLLQNIRTHLAQKADEIVKKKECESGLILCKGPKSKEEEGEEEKSEEIPPPPKIVRGQHKPTIKVNPKDVTQTLMPKAHKSLFRKLQKPAETDAPKKLFHSVEESEEEKGDEYDKKEKVKEKPPKKRHISLPDEKKPLKITKKIADEERRKSVSEKPRKSTDPDLKSKKEDPRVVQKKEEKNATKIIAKKEAEEKMKKKKKEDSVGREKETKVFLPEAFLFVLDENGKSSLCGKHSQIYLKQLKKYQIWALMMFDASAKFPSGILQGNINQFGDFDECLAINAVFKNKRDKTNTPSGIKGKYCLANVDVTTFSDDSKLAVARDRVESFRFITSTIEDPGHFIPRFSTINWGVCVPSACLAEHVEKFIKSRLEIFSSTTGLLFNVSVDVENCVVKDDLKFEWHMETAIVILFYLIILITSLFATFFDAKPEKKESDNERIQGKLEEAAENAEECKTEEIFDAKPSQGKAKKILMAFSLKRNTEILLSDNSKGAVECINGIKSLFTIMLYLAHKTIPLGMMPFSNRVFLTKISNQPVTTLFRASIIYTDSFLLISGVLTSYNLAKEISENKKIYWARKSISRFIRLTPALFAVVLFYAYVWDQLGSGPVWNTVVGKNSLLCRKYMWRNLLYVQNFFAFEEMCAPQTHQLALDMQLSLLAPFFVHLIHTYDKTGVGILQAMFILSSIMRYIATTNGSLSVVIYHGMSVSQLYKTANLLYSQTLHRASPYILGTIVGFYLKKFEKFEMPKAFAALGWILSFTFGFYSVVSPSPLATRAYRYDVQEAAQYAALSPVSWSLALSWLIVACHLGYGGFLNRFLCQRVFVILSRISYSVYLTQFLVFFYKVGVTRIPEWFGVTDSLSITEFLVVIGVSVVVTLLFDIPMIEIKKIVLENTDNVKSLQSKGEEKSKEIPSNETSETEDEKESETISREDSQETTEELVEPIEDEGEYEEESELVELEEDAEEVDGEGEEGEDENEEEEGEEEEDEEVVEGIFEIRPLRRSTRMHFSDEPDDKEYFKVEPEVEEKEQE